MSKSRLDEFLQADIEIFAEGGYSTIAVDKILEHRTPQKVAATIIKELPCRFARRVLEIENTYSEWRSIPAMAKLHETLSTSFRNIRLLEFDSQHLEPFTEMIADLRHRHKVVVPLVAEAGSALRDRGVPPQHWMHQVLVSRMGTEMLTAHYMSLLNNSTEGKIGIIDTKCDPAEVVRDVIAHTTEQFGACGVGVNLQVPSERFEFSFISQYLFFIVEELLLNSMVATAATAAQRREPPKSIDIIVAEDAKQVGIKISDHAGGIPCEHSEQIWEYLFSTTHHNLQSHFKSDNAVWEYMFKLAESTPLSGPGMGLPLCKLYTEYLGGSLHLMSVPGAGTDAYVYLHRIDPDKVPSAGNGR